MCVGGCTCRPHSKTGDAKDHAIDGSPAFEFHDSRHRPSKLARSRLQAIALVSGSAGHGLPGPSALDLDNERPAEKRPNNDEQTEYRDTLEIRLERNSADDVRGDQEFQAEQQNPRTEASEASVGGLALWRVREVDAKANKRVAQPGDDDRDRDQFNRQANWLDYVLEIGHAVLTTSEFEFRALYSYHDSPSRPTHERAPALGTRA